LASAPGSVAVGYLKSSKAGDINSFIFLEYLAAGCGTDVPASLAKQPQ
jgi:hypothetical protein